MLKDFLKLSLNEREIFLKKNKEIPDNLKECMVLNNESDIVDMPDNLIGMADKDRNAFISALEEFLGFPEFPIQNNEFMTWENVREMLKDKIDFGSHTENHKIMTKLSLKEIQQELSLSKIKIEKELNIQVRAFATPMDIIIIWSRRMLKKPATSVL